MGEIHQWPLHLIQRDEAFHASRPVKPQNIHLPLEEVIVVVASKQVDPREFDQLIGQYQHDHVDMIMISSISFYYLIKIIAV